MRWTSLGKQQGSSKYFALNKFSWARRQRGLIYSCKTINLISFCWLSVLWHLRGSNFFFPGLYILWSPLCDLSNIMCQFLFIYINHICVSFDLQLYDILAVPVFTARHRSRLFIMQTQPGISAADMGLISLLVCFLNCWLNINDYFPVWKLDE